MRVQKIPTWEWAVTHKSWFIDLDTFTKVLGNHHNAYEDTWKPSINWNYKHLQHFKDTEK